MRRPSVRGKDWNNRKFAISFASFHGDIKFARLANIKTAWPNEKHVCVGLFQLDRAMIFKQNRRKKTSSSGAATNRLARKASANAASNGLKDNKMRKASPDEVLLSLTLCDLFRKRIACGYPRAA